MSQYEYWIIYGIVLMILFGAFLVIRELAHRFVDWVWRRRQNRRYYDRIY
jgi:hypothetical protein